MKTLHFTTILALVLAVAFSAKAQKSANNLLANHSGVYRTFADFQAKKLDLSVDFTKEKHKIKVHDFINKSEIDVIHMDKKYTFKKKDIYGIRDGKGVDYRFYNDLDYLIAQADTIYIYTKAENITTSNGKNHQSKQVTKYFFSRTGDSNILLLTSENLKKVFPENHKMHDALDMMFKSESDLAEYDSFHKTFKVVRFLKEHLK